MLFSWSLLLSYFQIVVLGGVEMETVFWPDQDQLRVAGTGLVLHTKGGLLEGRGVTMNCQQQCQM